MIHNVIHADGKVFHISVPDGYRVIRAAEYRQLLGAAKLLSDLDRSKVGRHIHDVESESPTGRSAGNPFLTAGQRIGTTIHGKPITVPDFAAIHDERRVVTMADWHSA